MRLVTSRPFPGETRGGDDQAAAKQTLQNIPSDRPHPIRSWHPAARQTGEPYEHADRVDQGHQDLQPSPATEQPESNLHPLPWRHRQFSGNRVR
jgi:hypothetical protein